MLFPLHSSGQVATWIAKKRVFMMLVVWVILTIQFKQNYQMIVFLKNEQISIETSHNIRGFSPWTLPWWVKRAVLMG